MKRKFALVASVMAALLIVGTLLVLTSQPIQAASISNKDVGRAVLLAPSNNTYQTLPFTQNWSITTSITLNDDWSGVAGIVGYLGDFFPSSTIAIPDPRTILSDTTGIAVDVNANQTNPNTFGTGGVAEFDTLTDTVVALQGSGTADAPFILLHLDTTGLMSITVAYNLRDIDGSTDNAVQAVDLQYRIGSTGNFTNVAGGFVADATTGPSLATLVTPVTVTLPANANNQSQVQVRIITSNAVGTDEWVGVDDIAVTGTSMPSVFEPDLVISKSGPSSALAGDTITYTIVLSNVGTTTATATTITDTLPTDVTFVTYTTSLTPTFSSVGNQLVWNLGDVLSQTNNLTIRVRATISPSLTAGTSFTNSVTASTTATETITANNTASQTTLIGSPDLAIVKTGPASVNAGDTVTYTLVYSNVGTLNATGVKIVDQLPAGVTFVTETNGSAVVANGHITWTLGTLTAGAAGSIDLVAKAQYAGDRVNTATISGGPVDSNLLNNTASVTTTVSGADVYVLKSGPALAFGGQLISYTIKYGNSGDVTATATLTDQLPISFTVSDIAFDGSLLPFASGVWTANIAPDTEMSFTFALTVPTTISNSTRITNALTISAPESGDNPIDNAASASSTVYQIVPIATARAGAVGQTFGVEGQVIYVPNTFGTNEWGVQDASGGISVFYSPAPSAQLGDRVRLVATRGAFSGQAQLGSTVYYFVNLGPHSPVMPRPYTTGQVLSGTTEGWLSVVTGTVSGLTACSTTINYQFLLNDGSGATTIFVDKDTLVDVCTQGVVNGDRIVVSGFSTQSNGTFEIKPRFPADVKRLFDVTFVYNDPEDVVHVGEDVQLRGDFTNWGTSPITLSHDAGYTVFSATVTLPTTVTQNYKFYASSVSEPLALDLLNINNRSYAPTQGVTVKQEYRNTPIGWGNLNGPTSATINLGASVVVSGQVYVQSVTAQAGAGRGVKAEVGYGTTANPASWTWSPLIYLQDMGNNDVFAGSVTPVAGGVYSYAVRYDANFGAGNPNAGWTYADLDGVPFTLDQAGVLTVTAPQLALNKSVQKPRSAMEPGDVVTYTIELSNSGSGVASGVLITDVLPIEVTFGGFVTANGAQYAGGVITWSGSINAGVTATVIFTATVGNQRAFYGRTVTNTAQFTSSNGGSDSAEAAFQIVRRYFLFTPLIRR